MLMAGIALGWSRREGPHPPHARGGGYANAIDAAAMQHGSTENRGRYAGPRYSAAPAWTAGLFGCAVQLPGGRS